MVNKMAIHDIQAAISNEGTRNSVRKQVVNLFINEEPGQGKKDLVSKYNYYVETLSDGRRLFLTRPAFKKYGFDFLIRIENEDFNAGIGKRRDNPSHEDIINDLRAKKAKDGQAYARLYGLVQKVYRCKEVSGKEMASVRFRVGFPVDMILAVVKWFFIEQDIRYWNHSGRAMFMSAVPTP